MNIEYIKLSPTGNITVLVKTPIPRKHHAAVASQLLSDPAVGGEQVGFIESPEDPRMQARLQMMGGEFCGNATMSLGAVLAREAGLGDGECLELMLEVSGSDAPVPCRIRRTGDGWLGTVRMPLPTRVTAFSLSTDAGPLTAPLIAFPGIAHLILAGGPGLDDGQLRRRLPQWQREIGADALGALTWDEAAAYMDPLVCVPSAGTLVREHGCGSGSAAIGSWLALRDGQTRVTSVRQPGGAIDVHAEIGGGALTALAITGTVTLLSEGDARVTLRG